MSTPVYLLIICIVLALSAIILKTVIVFKRKGFALFSLAKSFFRIYSKNHRLGIDKEERRRYMVRNNRINYVLYLCLVLIVLILIVYKQDIFYPPLTS